MNRAPDDLRMAGDAPVLDPLRLPLRGSQLIEASAGTGKTFTIAALYLRLVLGHGGDAAFGTPLVPPQILVVTFTEAATKELRDRIRARLAEAARAFLVAPDDVVPRPPGEDFLHDLRASMDPADWPDGARRLRLAAEWMDEAAVSTIHGWCNRMLREHAFDSGSLFTQTLEADQRDVRADAVRDYWRSFIAPLALDDARALHAWWPSPDKLSADVDKLLELAGELPPGAAPVDALAGRRAADDLARRPWRGADGLAARLADQPPKGTLRHHWRRWMTDLRTWSETGTEPFAFTKNAVAAFDASGIEALIALQARMDAPGQDARDAVLAHAAHWCAARVAGEQERRAEMGFDELLTRLDAALRGPNGSALAALIRRQFPAALIDEFQDTDPVQYRIFDTVYGVAADRPDTALLLIGDPKQAIYAFRGADIFTYLQARRATAGRLATLGTNHRATEAMVDAVNQLFLAAEDRPGGRGAFRFRTPAENALPFQPVRAAGRRERWVAPDAGGPAALVFWTFDDNEDKPGDERGRLAAACASEIVRLLTAARAGQAGFADDDGGFRPLHPGDIAVLVNDGVQARELRTQFGRRGVRSVYLSDRDSVYGTAAAGELLQWLAACAEPDDGRRLRAALATATLGLDWAALDALQHDELAWERRVDQFHGYQELWRRQGVLPMLRHLMHDFSVPERLLAAGDDRMLTDLLHLAELMQQVAPTLAGEQALIRHLSQQRLDGVTDNESRKLRLESDADLVKVVTVHKAKGLEYPLVFLPFATSLRRVKDGDAPLKWHDRDGRRHVALTADTAGRAAADEERLGEDLRKLYVALTRARHALWVGVAPRSEIEHGALGYLLGGGEPMEAAALNAALRDLARRHSSMAACPLPAPSMDRLAALDDPPDLAPEPALPRGPRTPWWIASYSALRTGGPADGAAEPAFAGAGGAETGTPGPATAREDIHADSADDGSSLAWRAPEPAAAPPSFQFSLFEPATAALARATAGDGPLHGFPAGARSGTFLHGLLEWGGREGFGRIATDRAGDAADFVARRCNLGGLSAWTERLQRWLPAWLATPWPLTALDPAARPVRPADLGTVQVEMEFWFAADRVDATRLDRLVRRHTLDGAAREPLLPNLLNGMLKGFVDLVFEHDGRYYVADYKSNTLGRHDADYTAAALRTAVLAHRYELQSVLYVLALHRLLRSRLPDYDYDRHIGGALCIFLRGHAGPAAGVHAERPPRILVDALDALFDGKRSEPA